jgi:hypothetical protein
MNKEAQSIKLGIVIEALQQEEREQCAQIADMFVSLGKAPEQAAKAIAQAIRRRALPRGGRDWQKNSLPNEPHGEKRQRPESLT